MIIILMQKFLDDSNLLFKLKKHSQFKIYGILTFKKFKVFFKILDFQEPSTTCKWGVMCMTYKTKLYFMI
jgi:hypothetical protein